MAVVEGHTMVKLFAFLAALLLPNGWVLSPPQGAEVATGTMPQGMAPSPNGTTLAVVEAGYNPPTLSLYRVPDLRHTAAIKLPGAFGKPLWLDATHVLVAGANADALLDVDTSAKTFQRIPLAKGSYPILVAAAPDGKTFAVACDGDGTVRVGTLAAIGRAAPIKIGGHPGGLAFGSNGKRLFTTIRSDGALLAIDLASRAITYQLVGLHPSALAVHGNELYVAQTDADSVAIYNAGDLHPVATVSLRDPATPGDVLGVSPNAIAFSGNTTFVSLAAANSVAVIRDHAVTGRMQTGWYPTDIAAIGDRLYVLDGKGEGARPNVRYRNATLIRSDVDYIGAIEFGSLRAYDIAKALQAGGSQQGSQGWQNYSGSTTIVRGDGPIKHVFFVLKENRSYDQVLGDMKQGNGDAALAWFGAKVTPNEHAISARFGLFDNAYTSGEVSDPGHMWADTAFANDYTERFWPTIYGGRRDLDDLSAAGSAAVPAAGFIWEAARRAGVSFRDYGEMLNEGKTPSSPWTAAVPSLKGVFDPHYAGWDLDYSDLERLKEWRWEFGNFVSAGTLPQFEFIWLPNDHTYGAKAGKLTPRAYVATNDYALGQMVDILSHSSVWASSVMFVIEDDAQDGPDHVSDQRTTLYVISPYASGGVRHEHYATVSVLRTLEMMLGMQPLSTYDAMALPMYAAFTAVPDLRPYTALAPEISLTERNLRTAYGAGISEHLNFSIPDAVPDDVLNDILAHNH